MKTLFINANILSLESENGFVFGEVLVDEDTIKYIGKNCPDKSNVDRVIDVKNNILMPGFVNAHAHSHMTLLRGCSSDVCLDEWLNDNIFPLEAQLTDEDIYYGTMLAIFEYLRAGITTVDEFYFDINGMLKAFNETGYRARVSISARRNLVTAEGMNEKLKIITSNDLLKPVITAHSVYLVSEEDLSLLITFAKQNNLPVSIHLAETLKEVGDCTVEQNGLTPAQYLEELGFFDREATCYHCVHMDKDDLNILSNYNVNVVTCPSSNIKLASGIAPIHAMNNLDINVAIGTDGPASNDSLDMFKEMFLVACLSKVTIHDPTAVDVKKVISMATKNGAKALGYDNIGEIKVGNKADLILVDTSKPHWQPKVNMLSHLVYSAKSSDVYLTMINGNILFENDKINLKISENEIIEKVNNIYKRIKK